MDIGACIHAYSYEHKQREKEVQEGETCEDRGQKRLGVVVVHLERPIERLVRGWDPPTLSPLTHSLSPFIPHSPFAYLFIYSLNPPDPSEEKTLPVNPACLLQRWFTLLWVIWITKANLHAALLLFINLGLP